MRPRARLLTRRDLLRLGAAGAAGWAGVGCPAPSAPAGSRRVVAGQIHGQDVSLAHVLRTDEPPRRPAASREVDVLIVGAGVAGLTCAWRLHRAGVEAALVDVGADPGGNARGGRSAVSAFPWGAHYLRAPTPEHPALERFLAEAGLLRGRDARGRLEWDTRAVCAAPQERVYEGGLWRRGLFPPPRSGTAAAAQALARFEGVVAGLAARRGADGARAFAIPADLSSRDPGLLALDEVSFGAWLDAEGFDDPALRWLLEYACRDDYGCTLATTSAWAGLHYFCARRTDDPTRDVVLTWPEGNGRLVRLLREQAPVPFEGQTVCVRLLPGASPGDSSEAWLLGPRRAERVVARSLVWAGPQFVLGRVLPERPPHVDAFSYAPWLVANVTLERPPGGVGFELAWDNVFYGSPSLGYVVANRDGRGPTVVTWYLPLTGVDPRAERRRLLDFTHRDVADLVLGDLLAVHPTLGPHVRSVDAWRWGHAMVRPVPGFLWGPDRAAAASPPGALVVANSDLSGIPVFEEAFYRGVLAGEQVLTRRGVAFESYLG